MNAANSGVVQVPSITGSEQAQPLVAPEQIIQKDGYLYIYVSNESAQKVFFDNLVIHHNKGHLLEEDQYYPFGLKMAGISDQALPVVPNNYLYNGKELQQNEFNDGSGLDWYSYGMREYDPQLARFPQLDPLTDEFPTLTPYQYASNDPVANIDWDGLEGLNAVTDASKLLPGMAFGVVNSTAVVISAAKPLTTSLKVVKGASLASKIVRIANHAIQLAPIAEHIINGPFVTIARQALNQVGNRYPNNGFIQFGVGWMKQGVDFLHPDVVGNLVDNLRLGIQAYRQLKAGNEKGGVLSAVEATNPVVKMAVGETKLVKSAVGGNGQSQGRAAFQVATILAGGWEALESGTGEMGALEVPTSKSLSTLRYTQEGETFIRYESGAPEFSHVTSKGGVTPGTYAAPYNDGIIPIENRASTYNLPNPEIPRSEFHILRPPAGTPIIGPRPVVGGSGNEVIFPFGY